LAGAISMGQGMISYVLAEGLLEQGVSNYALSAFILAWITLGFVQIPAEASIFGLLFTIIMTLYIMISAVVLGKIIDTAMKK